MRSVVSDWEIQWDRCGRFYWRAQECLLLADCLLGSQAWTRRLIPSRQIERLYVPPDKGTLGTSLLLLNCHLTALAEKVKEREKDLKKIFHSLDLPKDLPVRKKHRGMQLISDPLRSFLSRDLGFVISESPCRKADGSASRIFFFMLCEFHIDWDPFELAFEIL